MKENKIVIKIKKEVSAVFEYSINPANSPLWVGGIEKEETNECPPKKGTVYRNIDADGRWSEYRVSDFKKDRVFELTSKDGNYHARYTYKAESDGTVLEYFERVDKGELDKPFDKEHLEKLRNLIEAI